ncbi:MAG: dephospho-CoA kinase [Bacteroidetes bacterium]|jgi:dephospho-CoA kinase|nr:dephospho-CoA kinase [Bacteroidota bacterium]
MKIYGITGGIGSGKSVVSRLMETMDIPVYMADIESKSLLNTSDRLKASLIEAFGSNVYKDGFIDRKLFASIIFNDPEKLQEANRIIHPFVKQHFFDWIERQQKAGKNVAATEAAILYESGFDKFVDKVILVYASLETRIKRTVIRDNISREEVIARINNQMPDEQKIKKADFVVLNDGTKSIIHQIEAIIKQE